MRSVRSLKCAVAEVCDRLSVRPLSFKSVRVYSVRVGSAHGRRESAKFGNLRYRDYQLLVVKYIDLFM